MCLLYLLKLRNIKNKLQRLINMLVYARRLVTLSNKFRLQYGKPDIIIASSVHPLTLVAGIRIAKKFKVPCVSEIRDLWPESLVAYGIINRKSIITRMLYMGEKMDL